MICQTCNKTYQSNYGDIHYFEHWWNNTCKSCKDEFVVCSDECRFEYCKKCKRDLNIDSLLKTSK